MSRELSKQYDSRAVEPGIYKMWTEGGWFAPDEKAAGPSFTVVIPPPNVTGQLHLGHAFDETLQDVLVRYHRMMGDKTLWVPGTDHAGIATQIKVEESLRKEGLTRHDLGREAFIERVWDWKEKYGSRIVQQLKTLGCSCDWSRERFTMDEGCSRAVREVFVSLYEKGLIYKGLRIINWCPDCATALSDAEVEYDEREGSLWHIRYPLSDGTGELVVATTRPETMLGDTAVAVNPGDGRYAGLVGKTVLLPLMGRELPIVADEYVETDFGTGCVKITPCHDPNDFEVAKRHGLPEILVMDGAGRINSNGGAYAGLTREEARAAVLRDLEAGGYLVKAEKHVHNVGSCYRCHNLVEPMASEQWFVKMAPLAGPALDAVREGRIKFVPERFVKTYTNWMENLRDWCISRQLWWGHRIPVWHCADCGNMTVTRDDPDACAKCGGKNITQDPDVLDTWFSSALWPFSTLGWPDKTADLETYYPTSVLVTGYDIIFFWVARMIFSGLEHTGREPFRTVLFHGLIRDADGKKMSKSSGNGVDPMEMIEKYGADALRINIITGNSPGGDTRFFPERCEAMRNFCNKLWNASRFVLMNLEPDDWDLPGSLDLPDLWILTRLQDLIPEITENMDGFELGVAAQKLYDFLWDDYCDWYIELSKANLRSDDRDRRQTTQQVLVYVLETALRLLHPFMPFITEEIWQCLPHEGPALMVAPWPEEEERLRFIPEAARMDEAMEVIRAVRARRAEMRVPPSKKAGWHVVTEDPGFFEKCGIYFETLAGAAGINAGSAPPADAAGMIQIVTGAAVIYIPMNELVDIEAERARLGRELAAAEKELAALAAKLANPGFTSKAPGNVVKAERDRLAGLEPLIDNLRESIANL